MEVELADDSMYSDMRKYGRDKSDPKKPTRSISEFVREFE